MSPLHGTGTHTRTGCGCGCAGTGGSGGYADGVELPADGFTALRVSYGMLLGENDFDVLMGNPRGKGMLHAAWLHGSGLIWGFGVSWTQAPAGSGPGGQLRVEPGLAVDGWGRELRLDRAECLDLGAWATEQVRLGPAGDGAGDSHGEPDDVSHGESDEPADSDDDGRTLRGWVVAEFATCLDHPVPALADPCDVTRRHDVCARVVETVRIRVRTDRPAAPPDHPRVRAFLGLDCDQPEHPMPTCGNPNCRNPGLQADTVDADVAAARDEVDRANPDDRACALLRQIRRLAVLDAEHLAPAVEDGDVAGIYPVTEDNAGVVLARLRMRVNGDGDCVRVDDVDVDRNGCRALLPTSTLQDLLAGSVWHRPGGGHGHSDAGGPRLVAGSLAWSTDRTRLQFRLTVPVIPGSQESAVTITSLSPQHGWAHDDIARITLHNGGRRVVVHLDRPPAHQLVRVLIRGTGDTPLIGRNPVAPFAGRVGGPPGSAHDGHDVALISRLSRYVEAGNGDEESPGSEQS